MSKTKDVKVNVKTLKVGSRGASDTTLHKPGVIKDKNKVAIKAGDFVKRVGLVRYADGERLKVSRVTFCIAENEEGLLEIPSKAEHIDFLIIGSLKVGILTMYEDIANGKIFDELDNKKIITILNSF